MRATVLAFAAVFAVKVALTLLARSPWVISDEVDYAAAAESIWNRGVLVPEVRGGQPYPPGYSLVLSPAYAAGRMRAAYHLMLAINCALTTLVGVAAWGIARRLLAVVAEKADRDPRLRGLPVAIGLAAALLPSCYLYSWVLMSENLFALLFALSCWAALEMGARRSVAWAALLGVLLALLFITRPIAVGLAPAALAACAAAGCGRAGLGEARGKARIVGRVALLAAGVAAGVIPWFLYKAAAATGTATGYSESEYLARLLRALSSGSAFLKTVRIVANDVAAVAVMCGGLFLILAVDLALRRSTWRSTPLRTLTLYVGLSLAGTLGLAALHQFEPYVERQKSAYAVLSRYFDPLVSMLIVLGGVGLAGGRTRASQAAKRPGLGRQALVQMAALSAGILAVALLVLPTGDYKLPNTLGLWHASWLRAAAGARLGPGAAWTGTAALGAVFAALTLWGLLGRRRASPARAHRPARVVLAAGMVLGMCGMPTLREVIRASRATAEGSALALSVRDLTTRADDQPAKRGATVYVDETIYAVDAHRAHRDVLMLRFWNPEKRVVARRREVAAARPRYLVSADDWPDYRAVARQDFAEAAWILYDTGGDLGPLLRDPGFIDVATLSEDRLEGFYGVDAGDYRWTSGRSVLRLAGLPQGADDGEPATPTDLIITLGTGGGRPKDSPAHVTVFFDGHAVGDFEKTRGGLYPSFRVPAALAAGADHRLELRMNTFRPVDYGWSDDARDLGLQLFWVKVRPARQARGAPVAHPPPGVSGTGFQPVEHGQDGRATAGAPYCGGGPCFPVARLGHVRYGWLCGTRLRGSRCR